MFITVRLSSDAYAVGILMRHMHITCRLCWDYVWATRQFNISTQTSGTKAFIGLQLTTLPANGAHLLSQEYCDGNISRNYSFKDLVANFGQATDARGLGVSWSATPTQLRGRLPMTPSTTIAQTSNKATGRGGPSLGDIWLMNDFFNAMQECDRFLLRRI